MMLWWGKARVTPWMHYQLTRLDAALRSLFGVGLVANSGIRTYEEQKAIFLERYVTAGNVKGRHVYDTRWWNGQLWYRISAAGTVAAPGSSNHEVQGTKAAVDIADTGSTAGITSRNSTRGRWLRQNAASYGMIASGDGFGEGWHFDITNIFATPPGAPAGGGGIEFNTKEQAMTIYLRALDGKNPLVANGNIYANDGPAGTWRGITNLESFFVETLEKQGFLKINGIGGSDMATLFAVRGVAQQRAVTPIPWSKGTMMGLGTCTGKIMFPGSQEPQDSANPNGPKLGDWHYPVSYSAR